MRPMSEKFIPEYIDPFRFAEQNLSLSGTVKVAEMQRLNSMFDAGDDRVTVDLQFGVDEQRITFINGHLKATLPLTCQRCLEPFKYEIMSDFSVGIVNTLDEANALPGHYEPALTKEGHLALRELIEDEIILNLPIIPRHEVDVCKLKLPLTDPSVEQNEDKVENPFEILKSLKDKQR